MAQEELNAPRSVVERNIALVGLVMQYLLDHPQVFDSLPDDFELVILPKDDPDIRAYNLELLDKYGSEGKPIVFARIKSKQTNGDKETAPSLFAPIPITAL
jgi:hypothetical protein